MSNSPLTDAEARNRIEDDLDSNMLVEAAAGTGKTHSIVGRMVNLIATGKCEIDQLAAVTFTRKAAAELRERFHARMNRESQSAERTEEQVQRLVDAANRIDQSFVGTFHAFCSMLLRERPIECNVDPGFREIEEQEDAQLREESWQTFLGDLYSSQDERLDRIDELGLQVFVLKKCFIKFAEFPDVEEWPHTPPPEIDLGDLQEQTREYIQHMRELIPLFPDERGTDQLMERYEEIARKADNINWSRRGEFFELMELFDTSRKATQKWWHDKRVAKDETTRFAAFRTTVKSALDWWYGYRYQFVIDLLRNAANVYIEMRAASGGLDFQDLLLKVASALRGQPKLRHYFQRRFTHLLVDEFQDTDPIQAEVLAFLTSENTDETDWQKCRPRPGSLFLVGDPKQSIYRFRRADIVTYKQVKDMLVGSGGQVVQLHKSFRSVAELRHWSNDVFEKFFGTDESPYSPAAVSMEAGRDDVVDGAMRGLFRLPVPDMGRDDATEFEADQIAQYIRWAIDNQQTLPRTQQELDQGKSNYAEPGDFLIVTWRKAVLGVYGEALSRYGIPNEVTGSQAFANLDELKLLLACLRAIDDSRNPIHYVAVLRSELFGFSDADLYAIVKSGGRLAYTAAVPDALDEDLRSRVNDVNERLMRYLRWIRNLPYAAALLKIVDDLGLLAKAASHREGNRIAGGFLKANEWLRAQSWDFDSATDVITYLEGLTENAEAEGATALPEDPSVVRVMNLHKVKGLEAPVVFLAFTYGASKPIPPNFHIDRSSSGAKGYLAVSKKVGTGFRAKQVDIALPSGWAQAVEEESRFKDAEMQRLLYVAATRAACQLVVSTTDKAYRSYWAPFHRYLAEAPELLIPSVSIPSMVTTSVGELPSQERARTRIATLWENAQEPSYKVVAAKEIALKGSSRPTWHASGNYGHKWGTAIHDLLEIHSKRPDATLDHHARRLAEELELGLDRVTELLATVSSVATSDIWQRASRAAKRFSEIPFESANHDGPLPTLTKGVIDLVFREADGWVLVDYKTDDLQASDVAGALSYYDQQLETYARFWEQITQEPVSERGVYFSKLERYESTNNSYGLT